MLQPSRVGRRGHRAGGQALGQVDERGVAGHGEGSEQGDCAERLAGGVAKGVTGDGDGGGAGGRRGQGAPGHQCRDQGHHLVRAPGRVAAKQRAGIAGRGRGRREDRAIGRIDRDQRRGVAGMGQGLRSRRLHHGIDRAGHGCGGATRPPCQRGYRAARRVNNSQVPRGRPSQRRFAGRLKSALANEVAGAQARVGLGLCRGGGPHGADQCPDIGADRKRLPSVPRIAARLGTVRVTRIWSPVFRTGAMAWGDQSTSDLFPAARTRSLMGLRKVPRPGISMVMVAGTVMRSPDPMGAASSSLMGKPAAGGVGVGLAAAVPPGFVSMPRARSTEAWAWATVADPVTVWAGSAERLPRAHVRRDWAAAAEA